MKKVALFLLAVLMVAGLAGCGGGGDDDDGLPSECIAYCQNACNKLVACGIFAPVLVNQCAEGCFEEVRDEDIDNGGECVEANSLITTLTCDQLTNLLGLSSSAADTGSKIGRFRSK